MKKDLHPEDYRMVVFKDISNDEMFLTRSCAKTRETVIFTDGNEYPLMKMEISSFSHPFFTGKLKFVDTAGRIDKFNKKFAKFSKK
ncbi:MAG: type B 50S ribosomal protein L31 [Saprospiraceae bacterium]|nr:type B 50S ribosomal protein L31 [Saprospiraceae bacterium]